MKHQHQHQYFIDTERKSTIFIQNAHIWSWQSQLLDHRLTDNFNWILVILKLLKQLYCVMHFLPLSHIEINAKNVF